MYKVIFDKKALEFLEKLEKIIAKRIYDKIISTKEKPHHFWKRLKGREDFKLRIGDYRAIADIDDNSKTIEVTIIGHRKNIYENK